MEEIKKENPAFSKIQFTVIDETENPKIANQYNYFLVPTFYVNGKKVHEGVATKEIVRNIFKKAAN